MNNDFSNKKESKLNTKKIWLYTIAWIVIIVLWIYLLKDVFEEIFNIFHGIIEIWED